jgi:hypothetical protein
VVLLSLFAQRGGSRGGEKDLRVIPGASHMFEEIGVIEDVAELAHGWYRRHLMV